MKLIAISLSNNCIKKPRCKFCYLKDKKENYDFWKLENSIRGAIEKHKPDTICFEYNGINLDILLDPWWNYTQSIKKKINLTMTTMPQVITDTFCGCIKSHGIEAISLSYDSEKIKDQIEWVDKAQIIKKYEIKLACNFLIEKIPMNIPAGILKFSDQLNLLTLKPPGKIKDKSLEILKMEIEQYKSILSVAVDNCLGIQLGLTKECGAGTDFIHINPDGTTDDCCFKEKCFFYKDNKSKEKNENKTYNKIAEANNMPEPMKTRYIAYMRLRWGNPEDEELKCQVGYAQEWADRFLEGIEYECSDIEGQRILKEIDLEFL